MIAIFHGYEQDEAQFQIGNKEFVRFEPNTEQQIQLESIDIGDLVDLDGLIPVNNWKPNILKLKINKDFNGRIYNL